MKTITEILAMDFPVFKEIYAIAAEIHKDQKRKDGKTPYMVHIDAVIENTYNYLVSLTQIGTMKYELELYLCVAALHDAFEDHPDKISIKDIQDNITEIFIKKYVDIQGFGQGESLAEQFAINVAKAVDAISKKPVKGQETYAGYVMRVLANEHACIVKYADICHNISDLGEGNLKDKYSLTKLVLTRGLK